MLISTTRWAFPGPFSPSVMLVLVVFCMLWHACTISSFEIFVRAFPSADLQSFPARLVGVLGVINVLAFLLYLIWAWVAVVDWDVPSSEWDWFYTPMGLKILCYPFAPSSPLGVIWGVLGSLIRVSLTYEWFLGIFVSKSP